MQKLSLTKEVLISGSNLFGRPAYLRLTPCSEPGWYWDVGTNIVPINRKLVRIKKNRVVLQYQAIRLNVVEHILPLRWTGLDGVIIEASAWPPYFGGMLELWQTIEPNLSQVAAKTGLWPHHNNLAWPTERPVPELLDELVNHRLLDLLGALAMIDHRRLPAGRVISIRGGHALDVQLITNTEL